MLTEVQNRVQKPDQSRFIGEFSILAFVLCFATFTSCGKLSPSSSAVASASQSVSTNPATPTADYTCTFTELDQFSVAQDPTQDFSSSTGTETDSIKNNTCRNVSNGVASSQPFNSVTRSGGLITLIGSSGTNILNISNNQVTTPQSSLVGCTNGVQATGTLSELQLDPVAGTIGIFINWTLVVNGCTQSSTPSGQSVPAPVVNTFTPPSDNTSPYLISLQAGSTGTSSVTFNQAQGTFSAYGHNSAGAPVGINYSDTAGNQFQFRFNFPSGSAPAVGRYTTSFGITTNQSISLFNCDPSPGQFDVTEIQFNPNGVLVSLSINFDGTCGTYPITGTVRYNQPQSAPAVYSPVEDTSSLNQLSMQSGPGDYIGQGKTWNYTARDGNFQVVNFGSAIHVVFNSNSQPLVQWDLGFSVPGQGPVTAGTYVFSGTPTAIGNPVNAPFFNVAGAGRACDDYAGQFQVLKANYDANGNVTAFEATFSQNCDWSATPLQGMIRFGTL